MTGLISLDEAEAAGSIESDTPDSDKKCTLEQANGPTF
jgi:hypothetical protein